MLLSVSLTENGIEFDAPGYRERYIGNDTHKAFEIEHRHGSVTVLVQRGMIFYGFGPESELIPNIEISNTYRRRSQTSFYPEGLITLQGPIKVTEIDL